MSTQDKLAMAVDTLRPEVREAWRRMRYVSELTKGTVMSSTADMELIFRDHLRLAGSLTARQTIDAISRAERAETELAALKARIAEAVIGKPIECDFENMTVTLQVDASFSTNGKPSRLVASFSTNGKPFRLVVEE